MGHINHKWTEEERQIVRRDFKHTFQSCRELARRLNVTPYGVRGQAIMMGICKREDRKPWSQKERDKLAELVPRYCPRRVAAMMHRSINSVVVESKRLHISRRCRNGWFTKAEVCEILGKDHKWVQRRIDAGSLKATYHYENRPSQLGGSAWHIEEIDVCRFIEAHSFELTGSNVDLPMIVDILVGIKNHNGV